MNSPLVIGLGAGLVSAVLFLSTATGSLLALLLSFLVALPGFLAGLGWGALAALISALTAAAIIGVAVEPLASLFYLAVMGLPVALTCYFLLLARPAGEGAEAPPAHLEWYPIGRVVAWLTLMAGGVVSLLVPLLGVSESSYRDAVKARLLDEKILSQLPTADGQPLDREKLEPLLDLFITLLPPSAAIAWFAIMLVNMWTAGKIIHNSGRSMRPWPDVAAMTYPAPFPLGFVAAMLLTFAPGIAGILATGFTGAFLAAYIAMGLVVLHVVASKSPMRPLLLGTLYLAMLIFGWVALVVAVIGVGEPVFKLRSRAMNSGQPPGGMGT